MLYLLYVICPYLHLLWFLYIWEFYPVNKYYICKCKLEFQSLVGTRLSENKYEIVNCKLNFKRILTINTFWEKANMNAKNVIFFFLRVKDYMSTAKKMLLQIVIKNFTSNCLSSKNWSINWLKHKISCSRIFSKKETVWKLNYKQLFI